MGAACKILINALLLALAEGMEKILTNSSLRSAIGESLADELLDDLTRMELSTIDGTPRQDGYGVIHCLAKLVDAGVVTDEVWRVLRAPAGLQAAAGSYEESEEVMAVRFATELARSPLAGTDAIADPEEIGKWAAHHFRLFPRLLPPGQVVKPPRVGPED